VCDAKRRNSPLARMHPAQLLRLQLAFDLHWQSGIQIFDKDRHLTIQQKTWILHEILLCRDLKVLVSKEQQHNVCLCGRRIGRA